MSKINYKLLYEQEAEFAAFAQEVLVSLITDTQPEILELLHGMWNSGTSAADTAKILISVNRSMNHNNDETEATDGK